MKKILFVFAFMYGFFINLNAQREEICSVYGTVQGIYYDTFLKSCSAVSSSEACKELVDELHKSFNMAVQSRKNYMTVNKLGCSIVLKKAEDGILFTIEAVDKKILNSVWSVLSKSRSVRLNKKNCS